MNPHPLATFRVGGVDSGCQGCDPAVVGVTGADPIRLCDACAHTIPFAQPLSQLLSWLRAHRARLTLPL